jgi:hypothetical protein
VTEGRHRGGQDDGTVRRPLRAATHPVTVVEADLASARASAGSAGRRLGRDGPLVSEPDQDASRLPRERAVYLDAPNSGPHLREERRLVSGSGAHLEHPTAPADPGLVDHERDHRRR